MKKKVTKQVVAADIGKDKFYACYKVQYDYEKVVIKGTKSFENNISLFDAFYTIPNQYGSYTSYFGIIYDEYYNEIDLHTNTDQIFDNDDKKYFEDVNKILQTNSRYFEQSFGIQITFRNTNIDYRDEFKDGTFYNGYFSSKWKGGKWLNGIWRGENILENNYREPVKAINNTTYYIENYNYLKKKGLWFDSPPFNNSNKIDIINRNRNIKKK